MFFDSKNFLYYWRLTPDNRVLFGGRASMWPTSIARTAGILRRAMVSVHPQLMGVRVEYAWGGRVAFTFDRMPHVGRADGVAYATGCCGSGVAIMPWLGVRVAEWVGGAAPPELASLRFPLVPAPYEGRAWFLPLAGSTGRRRTPGCQARVGSPTERRPALDTGCAATSAGPVYPSRRITGGPPGVSAASGLVARARDDLPTALSDWHDGRARRRPGALARGGGLPADEPRHQHHAGQPHAGDQRRSRPGERRLRCVLSLPVRSDGLVGRTQAACRSVARRAAPVGAAGSPDGSAANTAVDAPTVSTAAWHGHCGPELHRL
jgi:hypothetical protein